MAKVRTWWVWSNASRRLHQCQSWNLLAMGKLALASSASPSQHANKSFTWQKISQQVPTNGYTTGALVPTPCSTSAPMAAAYVSGIASIFGSGQGDGPPVVMFEKGMAQLLAVVQNTVDETNGWRAHMDIITTILHKQTDDIKQMNSNQSITAIQGKMNWKVQREVILFHFTSLINGRNLRKLLHKACPRRPPHPWSNQAFLRRGPRQGSDGTHLLGVQLLWHRALQNEGLARNVETSKPQTCQACYIWMIRMIWILKVWCFVAYVYRVLASVLETSDNGNIGLLPARCSGTWWYETFGGQYRKYG